MICMLVVNPGQHPEIAYMTEKAMLGILESMCDKELRPVRVRWLEPGIAAVYNCEGSLLDLQGNRWVSDTIITGVFFVVAVKTSGKIGSLNNEMTERYRSRFWEPEEFRYEQVLDAYFAERHKKLDETEFL